MGPAEIVASLKELCADAGPRLTTPQIVRWIERHGGYESFGELVAYAKKMKARQYARQLMFDDPESGVRIKRLWSVRDSATGDRHYHDIARLSPDRRRQLIRQYARFNNQLRSVRKAMADYFAGQGFFEFYLEGEEAESGMVEPRAGTNPAAAIVRARG